jgi:hypothetical protein
MGHAQFHDGIMDSTEATPSCKLMIGSLIIGIKMRLAINPG